MAHLKEKVIEDCLMFVGGRVVKEDGLPRLQYFQLFEELYFQEESLSGGEFTYGKLYNLSEITEFLVIVTQAARGKDEKPYDVKCRPDQNFVTQTIPFVEWKSSDWDSLQQNLVQIQTKMLRRDAKVSIGDIREGAENKEIDPLRSHDQWFTDKLFKVLELFTLHKVLAPFREALEFQCAIAIEEDEALMPLTLPKKLNNAFMDMLEDEVDLSIKKILIILLKDTKNGIFHSPSSIQSLFANPSCPLSFTYFLNRVNKLMRAWVLQVFEGPTTIDMHLSNARKSKSVVPENIEGGQVRALKKLQRSRARLNETVEDPLSEVLAAATGARRNQKRKQWEPNLFESESQDDEESSDNIDEEDQVVMKKKKHKRSSVARGTMLDKKKSATRLTFTPEKEDDSEDIEEPSEEDEVLPDVKKRAKVASPSPKKKLKSQQKMYEGRRVWTDEEKNAVVEGIRRFGLGKWAEIKKEYFLTLKFRTSGQIKDCFRTMKKRGELGDLDESSPAKDATPEGNEKEATSEGNEKEATSEGNEEEKQADNENASEGNTEQGDKASS